MYLTGFNLAIIAVQLITFVRAQVCYFPNGLTSSTGVPCNQSAIDTGSHTPCCNAESMCLDNGLCFGNSTVSRGSCTDPTWGSDCPQWCKDERMYSSPSARRYCVLIEAIDPAGGMPITPCDIHEVTFACNVGVASCQDANLLFHIPGGNGVVLRQYQVAGLQAPGNSAAMLVEATTNLTVAKDARVTVTATSLPGSPRGLTVADVAGAAVGVGVPLLLIILGLSLQILRQRRMLRAPTSTSTKRDRNGSMQILPSDSYSYGKFQELDSTRINEMSSERVLPELAAPSNGISY